MKSLRAAAAAYLRSRSITTRPERAHRRHNRYFYRYVNPVRGHGFLCDGLCRALHKSTEKPADFLSAAFYGRRAKNPREKECRSERASVAVTATPSQRSATRAARNRPAIDNFVSCASPCPPALLAAVTRAKRSSENFLHGFNFPGRRPPNDRGISKLPRTDSVEPHFLRGS